MKFTKLLLTLIFTFLFIIEAVPAQAFFEGREATQDKTAVHNFYNAGAGGVKSVGKAGDEFVNLASPKKTQHLLYGDETGGGHLWPGKPGKSIFPEKWSADKVMHEISDIVTDPSLTWQKNRVIKGVQRYDVTGTRDGISIKVITDGKDVITAFPVK